jgi:hypothetical protein
MLLSRSAAAFRRGCRLSAQPSEPQTTCAPRTDPARPPLAPTNRSSTVHLDAQVILVNSSTVKDLELNFDWENQSGDGIQADPGAAYVDVPLIITNYGLVTVNVSQVTTWVVPYVDNSEWFPVCNSPNSKVSDVDPFLVPHGRNISISNLYPTTYETVRVRGVVPPTSGLFTMFIKAGAGCDDDYDRDNDITGIRFGVI